MGIRPTRRVAATPARRSTKTMYIAGRERLSTWKAKGRVQEAGLFPRSVVAFIRNYERADAFDGDLARVHRTGAAEIFQLTSYTLKMSKVKIRYEVKRSVTGLGLFATEIIPAHKRIVEYIGTVIGNDEVAKRKSGKYFFGLDDEHSIDGTTRSNVARYINHSCRPNAEAIISGGRIWLWSKRNIRAGEEITCNYGTEYFVEHIEPKGCACAKCVPRAKV